jgi:hypothetical protein
MLDNEYTDVLMRKLRKYGKVKVPMLSEREVKYILADLISRGYKVRYEDGFFVFEGFRDRE